MEDKHTENPKIQDTAQPAQVVASQLLSPTEMVSNTPAMMPPPAITEQAWLPRLVKLLSFIFWPPFIIFAGLLGLILSGERHGNGDAGYAGLVLVPFELPLVIVGIFYWVLLVVYSFSRYPSKKQRMLSLTVVLLFVIVPTWFGLATVLHERKINQEYSHPQLTPDTQVINLIDSCQASELDKNGNRVDIMLNQSEYSSKTASSKQWSRFVAEVEKVKVRCGGNDKISAIDLNGTGTNSWISIERATQLLQQCEIKTFNYTASAFNGIGAVTLPTSGQPTGVILMHWAGGSFSQMYVQPGEESTMIPIARSIQSHCNGPQFYHDGSYEQKQPDGSWK